MKVKTPKDATHLIERLANLDAAYERLDPSLGIPAKAEAWDGKSPVPTKLDELAGGSSYALSGVMQQDIIAELERRNEFNSFFDAVDVLQQGGMPHDSGANTPVPYAGVADNLRNEVLSLSNGTIDLENGTIDLENGSHSVSVSDLWHSYSKHCLNSFIEDGHLNLTHDDLRMIPDIVENYDSVELINAKKGYSLVFTKEYGDVVYVVAETIADKKETPRGTRQKTIYLNEITKKASSRAFHPTPFSKNFTRTEIVNPISEYIKQNYADEAKNGNKVFFLKDGKLYPPMVANPGGADTPVGVRIDADEGVLLSAYPLDALDKIESQVEQKNLVYPSTGKMNWLI